MMQRDSLNLLRVHRWILIADASIELVTIGVQVNVRWPTVYVVFRRQVFAFLSIDLDRYYIFIDRGNERWIVKCLFVQKFARWTIIAIKVQKQNTICGSCSLNGGIVVFGPSNLLLNGEGGCGRQSKH